MLKLTRKQLRVLSRIQRKYNVSVKFLRSNIASIKKFLFYSRTSRTVINCVARRRGPKRRVFLDYYHLRRVLFYRRDLKYIKSRKRNVQGWSARIVHYLKKKYESVKDDSFDDGLKADDVINSRVEATSNNLTHDVSKLIKEQLELLKSGKRFKPLLASVSKGTRQSMLETIPEKSVKERPVISNKTSIPCAPGTESAAKSEGANNFPDMVMEKVYEKQSRMVAEKSKTQLRASFRESLHSEGLTDSSNVLSGFGDAKLIPEMMRTLVIPNASKTKTGENEAFVGGSLNERRKRKNFMDSTDNMAIKKCSTRKQRPATDCLLPLTATSFPKSRHAFFNKQYANYINKSVSRKVQEIVRELERHSKIITPPTEGILYITSWLNFLDAFIEGHVFLWLVKTKSNCFMAATIKNVMPLEQGAEFVSQITAINVDELPMMAKMLVKRYRNEKTRGLAVLMHGRTNYWLVRGVLRADKLSACYKPNPKTHPLLARKVYLLSMQLAKRHQQLIQQRQKLQSRQKKLKPLQMQEESQVLNQEKEFEDDCIIVENTAVTSASQAFKAHTNNVVGNSTAIGVLKATKGRNTSNKPTALALDPKTHLSSSRNLSVLAKCPFNATCTSTTTTTASTISTPMTAISQSEPNHANQCKSTASTANIPMIPITAEKPNVANNASTSSGTILSQIFNRSTLQPNQTLNSDKPLILKHIPPQVSSVPPKVSLAIKSGDMLTSKMQHLQQQRTQQEPTRLQLQTPQLQPQPSTTLHQRLQSIQRQLPQQQGPIDQLQKPVKALQTPSVTKTSPEMFRDLFKCKQFMNMQTNIKFRKVTTEDVTEMQIFKVCEYNHRWLVLDLYTDCSHVFVKEIPEVIPLDRIQDLMSFSQRKQKTVRLQFYPNAPFDAYVTPKSCRKVYFGPLKMDSQLPSLILLEIVDKQIMPREVYQARQNIQPHPIEHTTAFVILYIDGQYQFQADNDMYVLQGAQTTREEQQQPDALYDHRYVKNFTRQIDADSNRIQIVKIVNISEPIKSPEQQLLVLPSAQLQNAHLSLNAPLAPLPCVTTDKQGESQFYLIPLLNFPENTVITSESRFPASDGTTIYKSDMPPKALSICDVNEVSLQPKVTDRFVTSKPAMVTFEKPRVCVTSTQVTGDKCYTITPVTISTVISEKLNIQTVMSATTSNRMLPLPNLQAAEAAVNDFAENIAGNTVERNTSNRTATLVLEPKKFLSGNRNVSSIAMRPFTALSTSTTTTTLITTSTPMTVIPQSKLTTTTRTTLYKPNTTTAKISVIPANSGINSEQNLLIPVTATNSGGPSVQKTIDNTTTISILQSRITNMTILKRSAAIPHMSDVDARTSAAGAPPPKIQCTNPIVNDD